MLGLIGLLVAALVSSPAAAMSLSQNHAISNAEVEEESSTMTFATAEAVYLSAEMSKPTVVSQFMEYYFPTSLSDVDDSTRVAKEAQLNAEYPQLAEALHEIFSAEQSYPSLARDQASFIQAARTDSHLLTQFEVFLEHKEEVEEELRERKANQ